ncbi:MAG TPA: PilZ domain-containing protein [Candidatus Angelobacter sp.]
MQKRKSAAQSASRKYGRSLIDLRLVVKAKTTTLHGRSKNLGEGGMGATVAGDIPLGELVEVQFQVPQVPKPLVIRAEVRYRQGFQYGFKFLQPTEEQLELIRSTVRNLPPDQ